MKLIPLWIVVLSSAAASAGPAVDGSFFNPDRHMRVSEVRPGMKGYGLSVFSGTKIEKFNVEVVSVLRNYNPKRSVVLIKCSGQNLEHSGAVAGMSGSPVFLRDDQGRDRMIGAFAYGWEMAKDPVAGVQPIEYMLELEKAPTTQMALPRAEARPPRQSWDVLACAKSGAETSNLKSDLFPGQLAPLATPVMVAGISTGTFAAFKPLFARNGMVLLQGGAGGSDDRLETSIEPGSVVVAPLLSGDVDAHANGTCTEVIGDRVFAFGHPFNNEGPISIPMACGAVNAVISSLQSSFKIATLGKVKGTFDTDQVVGIAGRLGAPPPQVPISLRVTNATGTTTRYEYNAVRHPRFLPLLAAMALQSSLVGQSDLPQYNTVEYDLTMHFENGRAVQIHNVDSDRDPAELMMGLAANITAAAENPFERVLPSKIEGEMRITAQSREAQMLAVQLPRTRFHPGDRIKAFVTYRPFRGDETNLPIELTLPRDLPDGQYQLVIGDWTRYLTDEAGAKPFRFTAETVAEVFDILSDINEIRHDAIYVRLVRQPDGVAIGRVAMDQLPSSRRQVLLGAGRSNVTAFVSSNVTVIPTSHVMVGSADFTIRVESHTRVAGKAAATKPAG